jgi:DNA-directed RNA polymerase specialized sigma24 family protein
MTQIDSALYADVEKEVMPIIKAAAERFARSLGVGVEDAIQEGRIALLQALESYDYNQSRGGIYNFARTIVRNAMCGLLYTETTRSRCPHLVAEVDGETKVVRMRPTSLEFHMEEFGALVDDDSRTPEDEAIESQIKSKLRRLKMQLVNRLNHRQLAVFNCIAHPQPEFTSYLRNVGAMELTHVLVGEYLGIDKNSVDWSVHQIKRHFTALVESEFSELVDAAIEAGKWPMFHVSAKPADADFIQRVVKERELDARPLGPPDVQVRTQGGVRCIRNVENYPWGSVIMLQYGERNATVVAEGRFNPVSGEVLIDGTGTWKSILDVVPWYLAAHKFLKGRSND